MPGVFVTANLQQRTISALKVPTLGKITFNVRNFDNLIGTNESDSITDDGQNNRLEGKDGNDSITGGEGNDILTGGSGADKFIFNSINDRRDTIKDYNFGQSDVIQVSKVGFGISNTSGFSYNSSNGNLFFQGEQLAILENRSSNFSIELIA